MSLTLKINKNIVSPYEKKETIVQDEVQFIKYDKLQFEVVKPDVKNSYECINIINQWLNKDSESESQTSINTIYTNRKNDDNSIDSNSNSDSNFDYKKHLTAAKPIIMTASTSVCSKEFKTFNEPTMPLKYKVNTNNINVMQSSS